jgi:hypothetical protein
MEQQQQLPEEVELKWLALLPWHDLVRVALVCSRWARLGTSPPPHRVNRFLCSNAAFAGASLARDN